MSYMLLKRQLLCLMVVTQAMLSGCGVGGEGADLKGADLKGADLKGADLKVEVKGEAVEYRVGGSIYEGYYVDGGGKGLILIAHDWDGLTGYEKARSKMLGVLGYKVFAIDMYGKGDRPTKDEEKRRHVADLFKSRDRFRELIIAGAKEGKRLGGSGLGSVYMGYCLGGAAILEGARAGLDMQGFVSFHGGLTTPVEQSFEGVKGTILILHGTSDKSVSMDRFRLLANDLSFDGVSHEMITYGGAQHAFTVFGDKRYNKEADEKSWKRFLGFLEEVL